MGVGRFVKIVGTASGRSLLYLSCSLENIMFIRVCQKLNKKLVFISTDYVFDGKKKSSYNTSSKQINRKSVKKV